jgi:hypothetical protein
MSELFKEKPDPSASQILIPNEVVQLYRIAGWTNYFRAQLQYVKLEFGEARAIAVATDGHMLAVVEYPFSIIKVHRPHFEGKTFFLHGSSLKIADFTRKQVKIDDKNICLDGLGRLNTRGHVIHPLPYKEDETWLDWKGAIWKNQAEAGNSGEFCVDLKLLDRIRQYLAACARGSSLHFKITGPGDVIQGRVGTATTKFMGAYVNIDLFVMPMRANEEWTERKYLQKEDEEASA